MAKRLREGSFVIHKSCYDRFKESKRNRALSTKIRNSTEEGQSRGTRSQCPKLISFGDEKCMHCGKPEFVDERHKENNLSLYVAARKKAKREYVDKATRSYDRWLVKVTSVSNGLSIVV